MQNPVISSLGRRLHLAVIGGGPGSMIGAAHRQSALLDNRYELVAAVLSSHPERAKQAGLDLKLPPERAYTNVMEMLDTEASREGGADVVAIMTPNDSHYAYALAALERDFDVICDKPMTNTLEDAEKLHQKVLETKLVFCLTHHFTGYPMVRQAKAMVTDGQIGHIRLVQVEYVQGGKADENDPDPSAGELPWRYDPIKGGPSLVMGDIGTHAHNLVRFITGLEVTEVAAEVGSIVPDRLVHDYAGALMHFDNGARGAFWVTQAAAGVENSLRIRVSGTKGSLEWMAETPQSLMFKPLQGPSQNRVPGGPGTLPLAARACRIAASRPGSFNEGFANVYSDAAEAIAARRSGIDADPLALHFPNSWDGLLGVKFVYSVLASNQVNGKWVECA